MHFDFQQNIGVIERSIASLNDESYCNLVEDCLQALRNNRKIVISGLGKNTPVCEKFVSSMRSVGLDASFIHTSEAFHGDLGIIKEGDVVIVLSKSGQTPESLHFAEKLKTRKITSWAITFENKPSLSTKVDKAITLSLEHEGGPWNIMPMNSIIVYLFILQGVIIDLVNKLGITLKEFKANHPGGGIGQKLLNL